MESNEILALFSSPEKYDQFREALSRSLELIREILEYIEAHKGGN